MDSRLKTVAYTRPNVYARMCPGGLLLTQIAAAICGVAIADLMFELPAFSLSQHVRAGPAAVAVARALTDTFAGIRPTDVPGFIAAQAFGAIVAIGVFRWLASASARIPYRTKRFRISRANTDNLTRGVHTLLRSGTIIRVLGKRYRKPM